MKVMILGLFFTLIFPSPFHAQTAPTDSNAALGRPVARQASDDVTRKITDLVNAGKYAEAQQLTAGLLLVYPDDQRLAKTKMLLDKLLASAAVGTTTTIQSKPTNSIAQPAPNERSAELTGMDKVAYNSLIELGREAQETKDLDQQTTLLKEFMDKSTSFLQNHPNEMLLWQIRAVGAISLNDPLAGYEAGHNLLAAGGADSSDPNLQHLLAQLNLKGWLDKQQATLATAKSEAETMLTEAAMTTTEGWRFSGFKPESCPRSDARTLRYDQVQTFQVKNQGGFCYVAIQGHMPSTFSKTKDWEPNLFFIAWAESHCSDAHKFTTALSMQARSAASSK